MSRRPGDYLSAMAGALIVVGAWLIVYFSSYYRYP